MKVTFFNYVFVLGTRTAPFITAHSRTQSKIKSLRQHCGTLSFGEGRVRWLLHLTWVVEEAVGLDKVSHQRRYIFFPSCFTFLQLLYHIIGEYTQ